MQATFWQKISLLTVNSVKKDLWVLWILILAIPYASACFLVLTLSSFSLDITCSSRLLFLFIPLWIFYFVFPDSTDWFHSPDHVLFWPCLKFPGFNITCQYSNKTKSFLLIFVLKDQGDWKDETVSVHTRKSNSPHIFSSLTYLCGFSNTAAFSQEVTEIMKCIFSTLEKTLSFISILHSNSWHWNLPRQTVQRNCSCEQICFFFFHRILLSCSRKNNSRANCLKATQNM